jgi:hypothetical protein
MLASRFASIVGVAESEPIQPVDHLSDKHAQQEYPQEEEAGMSSVIAFIIISIHILFSLSSDL